MPAPKKNQFAKGNKGGRPTKFTVKLIELTKSYLDTCKDYYDESGKLVVNIPSLAGLARHLNVGRRTLYEWIEQNEEFSHTCETVLAEQESRLASNGLSGRYNSTIAKLMMSRHGYSDKVETDITSGGEKIQGINYIVPNGDHA